MQQQPQWVMLVLCHLQQCCKSKKPQRGASITAGFQLCFCAHQPRQVDLGSVLGNQQTRAQTLFHLLALSLFSISLPFYPPNCHLPLFCFTPLPLESNLVPPIKFLSAILSIMFKQICMKLDIIHPIINQHTLHKSSLIHKHLCN